MDMIELIEGISYIYNKHPYIGAGLIAIAILFFLTLVNNRYLNMPKTELSDLDKDFTDRKTAFAGVIIFLAYAIGLAILIYYELYISPVFTKYADNSRLKFILILFFSFLIIFLFYVQYGRKIGNKNEANYKYTIEALPLFICEMATLFFSIIFILVFKQVSSYPFRIIASAGVSAFVTIATAQSCPSFHDSDIMISNGENQYFVYRRVGDYYLCGTAKSRSNARSVFFISFEEIAQKKYKIFPYVTIAECYTQKIKKKIQPSENIYVRKKALYSQNNSAKHGSTIIKKAKKRRNSTKRMDTKNRYALYISLGKGSTSIYDITINASLFDFWGRKLKRLKPIRYTNVIHPGEEKLIKTFPVNNRKVYQCKIDIANYKVYDTDKLDNN